MRKLVSAIFTLALLVCFAGVSAQPITPELFRENPDFAGGIYFTYRFEPSEMTPVPKGFKPVYVSHFGRHGSRWHASESTYTRPQKVLNYAAKQGLLTEYGKELQQTIDGIARRAKGRAGELSPQGIAEQRGIAERMYASLPELFKGKGKHVECRSSIVPRCILSMAAFNERLKELNPALDIYRTTNEGCQDFMIPSTGRKHIKNDVRKVTYEPMVEAVKATLPDVLPRIFTCDYARIEQAVGTKPGRFVRSLYDISITLQDTDGDLRIDHLFTPEQRMSIWEPVSADRYATFASSLRWGDAIHYDAAFALEEIVRDADEFFAGGGVPRTAFLRFGHDVTVIALLGAMQIEGKSLRTDDLENLKEQWADFRITRMSTNLQFVFYRNKVGEVIVKLLHNEKECRLPVAGDCAPYYRWEDMRNYFVGRIAEIRSTDMAQILSGKKNDNAPEFEAKNQERVDR